MAGGTTLKLGYSDPLTDAFGAHPTLGSVIDLNDGATFTLVSPDGLEIPAPPRSLVLAGNIRTQGEIATRSIIRHNRTVTARLIVGPSASSSALIAAIRNLLLWLSAPPQTPITLEYQPFNASAPLYLDVVGAAHNLPSDEGQWLRGQFEPLTLAFTCRPGLRGARRTLQNLAANPGYEQPSTSGVKAFSDDFSTTDFYSSQAGAAPSVGAVNNNYPDVVKADSPLRYYRLSEPSGTVAYDVSGSGQNGTYHASPTLGVTGPVFGDSGDKAVTFNGTSQYVGMSGSAGLPTAANATVALECWLKFAAAPAATEQVMCAGDRGTPGSLLAINLLSSGAAQASNGTVSVTSAALTTGAWHHVVAAFDGTTLHLYVDGAEIGTGAAASLTLAYSGTTPLALAACSTGTGFAAPTNFFGGSLDECALYGSALSSTRVSAHYNAGNAGTGMGTTSNTLTLPAAARVAFGSPAWASLNTWQARFRYTSGGTYRFYLHYSDASNYLRASVSGTALSIEQVIAGVTNTLATTTISLASNVWYWLRVTQFPAAPNEVCDIAATILTDGPTTGTVGASLFTAGPSPTSDAVTALAGRPQIEASGAALILGGPYSDVHTVSLYGPGGWQFGDTAGGSAYASGAWEQQTISGNQNPATYSGGPVKSFGAIRIDAPPAGAFALQWHCYTGGSPTGTFAIPAAPSQQFAASVYAKSTGLAASGTISLIAREYDASGSLLRSGTIASHAGDLAAWTPLSGTYTTGANCAWLDLAAEVSDATAASANATVWFDNAQLWNKTQLSGMTSMPWCDLRAAVSPAVLVVSGLEGDLPAPAYLAVGTFVASLPKGGALSLYVGRKGITSPNARLVNVSYAAYSPLFSPQGTAVLDPGGYGGMYSVASMGNGSGWNARFDSELASDAAGVYHLLARVYTEQTTPNLGNVSLRSVVVQQTDPWYNLPDASDIVSEWEGPQVTPFAATTTWTVADAGQLNLPPFPQGALTDPGKLYLIPRIQWQDLSSTNANGRTSWQALLPIDGSLLVAIVNNPGNSAGAVSGQWLWVYADGLLVNRASVTDGPAWTYSRESGPTPNPGSGAGGSGTQSSGAINVNSGADPYLLLDPSEMGANTSAGVNHMVAVLSDQAGGVYPLYGEISYAPLYLEPK